MAYLINQKKRAQKRPTMAELGLFALISHIREKSEREKSRNELVVFIENDGYIIYRGIN